MNVLEHHRTLSTSLLRRFTMVRGGRTMEEIGKAIGVGHVTLYAWLTQDRTTRVGVLAKIETWVHREETHQAQQGNA